MRTVRMLWVLGLLAAGGGRLEAYRLTGNEWALDFSEARTEEQRITLFEQVRGRAMYFRYLLVMEMEEVRDGERESIRLTTFEPSSLLDFEFVIDQPVSLARLREEPPTKVGSAVAVRGRVAGVDRTRRRLRLDPVMISHKDRLSPAIGKEMRYELDPDSIFYSFTDGPRPLHVTYRDRDLVQPREEILEGQGSEAWFQYLDRALAERIRERQAARGSGP